MDYEYEIVKLQKIATDQEMRIRLLESDKTQLVARESKNATLNIKEAGDRMKDFAAAANISEESLRKIFKYTEDDIELKKVITGKSERERQFKGALCLLTAYYYLLGIREIASGKLKEKLDWLGITSLSNLNVNLKNFEKFIAPKGSQGSQNFAYSINLMGLEEGLRIIRELAKE